MPNKAKLVTRSTATSSVTTDNLNKGSALEFAELDSSLINLRDQTFGIVADDSSTIDVGAGDTLYIQGGTNVTTSTNSDGSITINSTASGGSVGDFTFSGDDMQNDGNFTIESTASAATISIIAGTDGSHADSKILLDTRRIFTGQNNTNINIQAPGGSGDLTIANGGTTGSPAGFHNSIVLTDTNDGEITITPKTGKWVEIDGLRFPTADGTNGQALVTNGSGVLSFATVSGGASLGDLTAVGSSLISPSNADLTLDPSGTGKVQVNGDLTVTGDLDVDVIRPEAAGNDIHIQGLDVDVSNRSYLKLEGGAQAGVWIKGAAEISMDHADTIGSGGVFHSNEIFTTFNKGKNDIQNFIIRHHQSTDSGGNTTSALFHLETYADRGTTNGGGMITIGDLAIAHNGSSGKFEGSGTELFNVLGTVRLDQLYIQDNKIYTNTSNSDLDLEANGSGKIKISGLKYPNADGTNGQFLKTDGSGNLSFATAGAAALTGSTNNTITTVTGANAIQGEANLTFDGTTLATTGSITATNNISSEAIQLVDNVISASRSNDSLFIEPAGTGIVSLGNGKIDGYSTNARWKNGVVRVFEDLAFDADSQTSSGDRKYLHTTLTNVKFNGDNSSNSNARWRNSYNILQLDMNSSELTPSGSDRITGLIGEVDILNSDTSTAGRLSHSAAVWGNVYAHGAGDLTVNNMASVIARNFVESASGKTITVDQSTGFQYNGTSKDGSGTDTITAEIGFLCAGPMTGATAFAFKDDTNGQSLFGDVLINQNTISTNSSNANLEINANGSGTVVLENLSVAGDGATVTGILDEDDMSSNSNTKLATQQSIKAYVDANAGTGDVTGSSTTTFTNKTIDANGTGNNISNIDIGNMTAAVVVLESEGIGSNDNDTTLPTSAAVKDYADSKAVLTGSTNNTIATVTGAHALNGEANLTFDGSTLAVTGAATVSTTLGVTGASTLDGITITDNTISSNASNANLEISANGTGNVSISSDGTFSSGATDVMLDNFGDIRSRCKGVHLYRQETISSALTSSGDRRQGHLIGQEYTLGNYSSSDKDNRYRGQTVACAVDLNGATVNTTNNFGGAMGAQGQAAVQNRDASNAGTIGNTIGVMGGSYFYSPQTVNITNAHGVFSYVEQDDGGGAITLTNAFAFKGQINKYHGTLTNGYAYYIDTNDATNKYGFYDTTNSQSRFGAVRLDNQSGHPTSGADFSYIYALDTSSSSEVWVKDEAGNQTQISPHNEEGEWQYYSKNTKTGKTVRVNMERMIKKLEELTGETFIESV